MTTSLNDVFSTTGPHLPLKKEVLFNGARKLSLVSRQCLKRAYHFSFWFDQGSVGAVHLVVEAARVAQVVAVAVSAPERRRRGGAVDAFSALCKPEMDLFRYQ